MVKQKTIGGICELNGNGLHTGNSVCIKFLPAPINQGVVFKRVDVYEDNTIQALADYVTDTSRGTTISNGKVTVKTIEHLLAAIIGLNIDNITIEINREETPIIDGSALSYIKLLQDAKIVEQEAEKKVYKIEKRIELYDNEKDVHIFIEPCDTLKISCTIDYNTHIIPVQQVAMESIDDFAEQFAPARTFAFLHEIEPLLKHGLIKGGDLYNSIIFIDHIISDEEQQRLINYFNMPNIKVTKEGILNNVELRFENEPARHKLIDILGDITLVGMSFTGHIFANRPGHKTNTDFAKIIRKYLLNGYGN